MKKIYVGNLPYEVTDDDLRDMFSTFGSIAEIKLITDRETGRSKGFSFVEFDDESSVEGALTMNGQDYKGRPLKVSLAREKTGGSGGSSRSGGRRSW